MMRSLFKTVYWFVQLTICLFWLVEKWQPAFLPSVYCGPRFVLVRPLLRQPLAQPRQRARPRLLSWRRLLFLLG